MEKSKAKLEAVSNIENQNEVGPIRTESTSNVLETTVKQEIYKIIRDGDLSGLEEFAEDPLEPISISKHSSKTLRWVDGLMEAIYGGETPKFPMPNFPNVAVEDKKVVILDYEICNFEQPVTFDNVSTLSKLLNIRIQFRMGWSDEEKTESFIVKVPPEGTTERELAGMARTDRREIFCYTVIFPYLQQWSLERNVEVRFAVPYCYLAKKNRKLDDHPVHNILENIPEAESLLVFQDLRPMGYGKRHFAEGISVEEAMAAICEIAKIHAISYGLQQKTGQHLEDMFSPLHKPLEVALLYDVLLEDALVKVKKFLASSQYDTRNLVERIKTIEGKMRGILTSLLDPCPAPYPTCLTHMDFWCDNIVFRRRDRWENPLGVWSLYDSNAGKKSTAPIKESSSTSSSYKSNNGNPTLDSPESKEEPPLEDSPLECRILDWQMVSFGRPSHDLALLLMTSLPTQVRRKSTHMLLKYYFQCFMSTCKIYGVDTFFDLRWIQKEYKRSKLLAALFIIASADLVLSDPATQVRLIEILSELVLEGHI